MPDFRRALHFVPRNGIQKKLDELFNAPQSSEETAIISLIGMGGAGKTQIALEYCQYKRQMYGLQKIFWIDATSLESVYLDMKNIAKLLDPSRQLEDANAALKYVKELVSSWTDPWLMIFDNLDDPLKFNDIPSLFPHSPLGAILITSRHHGLKELSPYYIPLQEMDEMESFDLLLGHQPSRIEAEPAKQILERLGWLPLALDQARAYISKQAVPLQKFIKEFDERKKTVLQTTPSEALWPYKRKDSRTEKEQALSVYTTWEMSLLLLKSSVGIKFPQLEKVLTLLAFFHPHAIDQAIFSKSIEDEAFTTSPMMIFKEDNGWNHIAFEETIATMQEFSLLQFAQHDTMGVVLSLHALISEWLRMRLDKDNDMDFIQPAMNHLGGYMGAYDFHYQERIQSLLHIDTVLSVTEKGADYSQYPFYHPAKSFA
ncbi:MAG TPA: NB-ARC domain-containing protein, partial [Chlamydiales bacterium]|nr:NB-ARC domain-containing protein [Chlamydiales bacterium]